jgi:hypothetical protein
LAFSDELFKPVSDLVTSCPHLTCERAWLGLVLFRCLYCVCHFGFKYILVLSWIAYIRYFYVWKLSLFNLSLFCKNYRMSKIVLYIINRKINGCLEIPDLFLVFNIISHSDHSFAALTREISCSTLEINLVFLRTHVLFSIYVAVFECISSRASRKFYLTAAGIRTRDLRISRTMKLRTTC